MSDKTDKPAADAAAKGKKGTKRTPFSESRCKPKRVNDFDEVRGTSPAIDAARVRRT